MSCKTLKKNIRRRSRRFQSAAAAAATAFIMQMEQREKCAAFSEEIEFCSVRTVWEPLLGASFCYFGGHCEDTHTKRRHFAPTSRAD